MWAYVRTVGAQGIFYAKYFKDVHSKDEWFEKYSEAWELHHFLMAHEYVNLAIPEDAPKS